MVIVRYALKRVTAFLHEIELLKQSEFPYHLSQDALIILERHFERHLSTLQKISLKSDSSVIFNTCKISTQDIFYYTPILGFILRSTNVRNAFEAYPPLLRLARNILGPDTKLIFSSEWMFSPHVYSHVTALNNFVFIGLPAQESSNPLLIPLSGHEFGHAIWRTRKLAKEFEKLIQDGIIREITTSRWSEYEKLYPQFKKSDVDFSSIYAIPILKPIYFSVSAQIEEIFCDLFGLRLFAESYMHAFAYLLSPGTSIVRSENYPNTTDRVSFIAKAAKSMDITVTNEFTSIFESEKELSDSFKNLHVLTADTVVSSLFPNLIKLTINTGDICVIPVRDSNNTLQIYNEFNSRIAPMSASHTLTDILNAGWKCELDEQLWHDAPQITPNDRDRILRDLILKSMEVSEIYICLGGS
jgi:hypothetical protein